jgi:pimeloyl-ACP methyl ester carboxylesterase
MILSQSPEPSRPRTTGSLRVDGAHIHFEVSGQGPALVFAHGLGGNHMSWWQQVAHFERSHTCVTFAQRGFAPSSVDEGQPEPARYADDLKALLDHLNIDRAHLVGQSMGGWTLVEFCLAHAPRVLSLTLSATTGTIDPGRIASLDQAEFDRWKADAAGAAADCRAGGRHPAAGPRMAQEQPAMHRLYQQIDEMSRHLDKEVVRSRLWAMRTRAPAELAATGVPVLMISPDEDIVIPPLALRALARDLPGARCAIVERAGHSPYFERAAEFNRHLEVFLGGIEGRRA